MDPSPIVTNDAPSAGFPVGTTTVTWTAADGSGNSATATQKVTIKDTTPPSISAPADIGAVSNGTLTKVSLGTPTVTDIANPSPIVTNDAPSAGFPVGPTIVTWKATDHSGNSANDTQYVTISTTADKTLPVVSVTSPTSGAKIFGPPSGARVNVTGKASDSW